MINVSQQPLPSASTSVPSTSTERAPRRRRLVRCEVIVVEGDESFASDLLPWADPYIASLVASLQREEGCC